MAGATPLVAVGLCPGVGEMPGWHPGATTARLVLVILPRSVPSTLAQCVAIYDCCSTHRRNGGLLTTAIMDPSSCGWHGIALGRIA